MSNHELQTSEKQKAEGTNNLESVYKEPPSHIIMVAGLRQVGKSTILGWKKLRGERWSIVTVKAVLENAAQNSQVVACWLGCID